MFPDSSLPTPINGGFQNQEEFWKYVLEHQNSKWETKLTAIPTTERERDYYDDTLGDAFPLHFPYSHTGLRTDLAVIELNEKTIRKCNKVFKKHRKTCVHSGLFNLMVKNLITKDAIFQQTQIQCNRKSTENIAMGESTGPCLPISWKRQFKTVDKTAKLNIRLLQSINSYDR